MIARSHLLAIVAAVSSGACFVFACSSSDDTPVIDGADATTPDATVADASDASVIPETSIPDTAIPFDAGDAGECTGQTTKAACRQCCVAGHPKGATSLAKLEDKCRCAADRCATACAGDLCATPMIKPDAGSPCATCVASEDLPDAGDGGCIVEARVECKADVECTALLGCETTALCGSKP